MDKATLKLDGHDYVVVAREEFDRLKSLASLPPLPKAARDGSVPAVAFGRASLARKIMRARLNLGLSQKDLAARAGIRVETLCRIETGRHTASVPTVGKLDRALKKAAKSG